MLSLTAPKSGRYLPADTASVSSATLAAARAEWDCDNCAPTSESWTWSVALARLDEAEAERVSAAAVLRSAVAVFWMEPVILI